MAALAVSFAGVVVVVTDQPAQAALRGRRVITYNLQGSRSGRDNKWTTTIGRYYADADVVAVQEAGPDSPALAYGTRLTRYQGRQLANGGAGLPQVGHANEVAYTRWRTGRNRNSAHVYFLQTDPRGGRYVGGRNNLAIVTHEPAVAVAAVANRRTRTHRNARATLGVLLNDGNWYFNVHATGAADDGRGLLRDIAAFVRGRNRGEHWVALGDYNQEPDQLQTPAGARIYNTGRATHQAGRELDYAVNSTDEGPLPTRRLPGATADHYGAFIGTVQLPEPPVEVFSSLQAIESMDAGGVLDAKEHGTSNGTPIVSYKRTGKDNQSWLVQQFSDMSMTFRGQESGRCIDITNSDRNPGPGRSLSLWKCTGKASQRWRPIYLDEHGEYELRSQLRPDLCMNVRGEQHDPTDAKRLILYKCENTRNERWIFTPAYKPSTATVLPTPPYRWMDQESMSLETLNSGAVMDVLGERTGNNSAVGVYHRTGGTNQGWDLGWRWSAKFGGLIVTLSGLGSHRCLDVPGGARVVSGMILVIHNCSSETSQTWLVIQEDNETVNLLNAQNPNLCLDVAGKPTTPNRGRLIVFHCNGQANQSWIFTPLDPD
ncbi:ricin-type beta-trefoil lectin domain protein [Mangrovihabitans endophyticus]|uniref:ricin-type beta-trefoil lectin domain protein n=1 Tax=Mangrovihabitans endophyticus TaxID=1751298 RepID=UPI00188B4A04|nr:ricin-type beta-trefoil lectin domain protein [Mangrovihabitans endophyticus]